jgi:hypothetical protein
MFFKKSKRNVREPDETVRLTPSIEAVIWKLVQNDGKLHIRFGLNRIDAKGEVRRTFSPSQIGELVASLAGLAVAIGQADGIDVQTAASLRELGAGIYKVLDAPKGNGPEVSDRPNEERLFP